MKVYLAARWEQAPRMREWRRVLAGMGIGIELKPSYYRQAVRNLQAVDQEEPVTERMILEDT